MADDVKRAIRACLNEADECERRGVWMSARDLRDHLRMALSALEAATVAPAVDREALATVLQEQFPTGAGGYAVVWEDCLAAVDALLAALGARDVRDVQAEGADLAADWLAQQLWPDAADYAGHVRQFAQAIREARSER